MRVLIALSLVALLSGCGAIEDTPTVAADVDLTEFARTLPTPAGLRQSVEVTDARTEDIQVVFAQGIADAAAAANYRAIGFKKAVIRRWAGAGGATVTLVASRWGDAQTATNVGGGAAERVPFARGARAWTPRELPGARGSRQGDGADLKLTLSTTVGTVNIVILTSGGVGERAVVRTMDLATRALNR